MTILWFYEEEAEKKRQVIIACGENDCDGVFVHESWLGDFSPRVHEECTKCKRFMSVKLSNIDESRILERKVIE